MRAILFMTGMLLVGTGALAQSTPSSGSRLYVSGGISHMGDNTWVNEAGGHAGTATVGVELSKHVGLRLTVDVPPISSAQSGTYAFGSFRTTSTERFRSVCWSGLVDFHGQLTDRVRLGVLAGLTEARHLDEYSSSTDQLGAGDAVIGHVNTAHGDVFPWWGATVGVELPIALTRHVAVVPEARATGFVGAEYGRDSIGQAAISLRWRF